MLSLLKNPGEDFNPLLPKMRELYVSNFEKVYNKMIKFREIYNNNIISFIGAGAVKTMKFKVSMDDIINEAVDLYKNISGKDFIHKTLSYENEKNEIENKKNKKDLNQNDNNDNNNNNNNLDKVKSKKIY